MQEHYGLTRIVSDTETWRLEEKTELHVFRSKTNNCSFIIEMDSTLYDIFILKKAIKFKKHFGQHCLCNL